MFRKSSSCHALRKHFLQRVPYGTGCTQRFAPAPGCSASEEKLNPLNCLIWSRYPLGYLFLFYCFKGQFLDIKLLRIFQGCFTVQLSMYSVLLLPFYLPDATFIRYHIFQCLSTTFFIFLFCHYFATKLSTGHPWKFLSLDRDSLYRLSPIFENVKYFFLFIFSRNFKTEKEGFEPSRRVNDLHP